MRFNGGFQPPDYSASPLHLLSDITPATMAAQPPNPHQSTSLPDVDFFQEGIPINRVNLPPHI